MYQTEKKILVGYRQHSPNAHIPVCGTKLPLRQFSPWQQCTIIMVIFCTTDLLLIRWTQCMQAGRGHRALLLEAHCLELGCSQEKGKIRVWNCSEKQIPLLDFPFLAKCSQTATQQRLSPAAEATSSHRAWHLHRVPSQASPLKGRPETKLASGQKLWSKCLYSVFLDLSPGYFLLSFSKAVHK